MDKEETVAFLRTHGYTVKDEDDDCLGEGSFSVVYKCKNPQGNTVAAKVIYADDEKTIQREINTAKEVEAMKPLNWKKYEKLGQLKFSETFKKRAGNYYEYFNVPSVKEIADKKIKAIIEAPLMDSDTWKSVVESYSPVNYEEFKDIAKAVLNALTVLHARGLAHYDIKPDNIYQCKTEKGLTKYQLGDFGLSGTTINPQGEQEETEDYRKKGSPAFAAPELFSPYKLNQSQVKKVDIYSLGATLIFMYFAKINRKKASYLISAMGRMQNFTTRELAKYKPKTNCKEELAFWDFVKRLTESNPEKRPTAQEALKHDFLK